MMKILMIASNSVKYLDIIIIIIIIFIITVFISSPIRGVS